jgi:capsid assembly protease
VKNYPHLAARIFNTPLLIHPQKLDAIVGGLGSRLLGVEEGGLRLDASVVPSMFSTRPAAVADSGLYRIDNGVAVISVDGALVHRSQYLAADSTWLLGYDSITVALEDAMANTDVHAVLLSFDSPGGEVQGAFEFAQRVLDMRGKKPMQAIADGMAASAAYLSGSAADRLSITTTGYAGSIGVVMRHVDFSQALAADGINVTHIFAGAHKVDGNQFEPLPAAVRADLQAEIDSLYQMFVDAVATHRGLDPAAVRATQAQTYRGQAAVQAGLADRVTTTDQVIAELAALRSARSYGLPAQASATKGASMSTTDPAGSTQQPATVFTQADLDRARAEGHATGATDGAATERARVSAIQTHPEAVGRTALATMCIAQGLSAEQAGALLAAAPKDQPSAAANPFAAAMGGVPNPLTKPDAAQSEGGTEAEASATLVTSMVSLFQGNRAK